MSVLNTTKRWRLTHSNSGVELTSTRSQHRLAAQYLLELVARGQDPVSGQFQKSILDLPKSATLSSAELVDSGDVKLRFEELPGTEYSIKLEELLADAPLSLPLRLRWTKHSTRTAFETQRLVDLETSVGALDTWLTSFLKKGLVFVDDVPLEPEGLRRIVGLFGYIRETNYGELFDVRTEAIANNLAYTSDGLMLHTDNPYREPVPGLQLLHCIDNSASGGDSIFTDGFAAALRMKGAEPQYFEVLTRQKVCFRFKDFSTGTYLEAMRPIIQLDHDGEFEAVHFNHRSLQAIRGADESGQVAKAYRRFAEFVNDEAHHLQFKLPPGEAMLFDNHRILHGRTGFDLRTGSRHLQGCYCDKDSLWSRWRFLHACGGTIV